MTGKPIPVAEVVIEQAKARLHDAGYVVLKEASYRRAQERQRIAEALMRAAEENYESTFAWGQENARESRRLYERLTFVYGVAVRHGATDDELRGPGTPLIAGSPSAATEPVPVGEPDATSAGASDRGGAS